jgi:hypothetical protein
VVEVQMGEQKVDPPRASCPELCAEADDARAGVEHEHRPVGE